VTKSFGTLKPAVMIHIGAWPAYFLYVHNFTFSLASIWFKQLIRISDISIVVRCRYLGIQLKFFTRERIEKLSSSWFKSNRQLPSPHFSARKNQSERTAQFQSVVSKDDKCTHEIWTFFLGIIPHLRSSLIELESNYHPSHYLPP